MIALRREHRPGGGPPTKRCILATQYLESSMGMPLTPDTYEVLAALAGGESPNDEGSLEAVRRMLDNFPVVALVLYDPNAHPGSS